jgi:hypothetical protein
MIQCALFFPRIAIAEPGAKAGECTFAHAGRRWRPELSEYVADWACTPQIFEARFATNSELFSVARRAQERAQNSSQPRNRWCLGICFDLSTRGPTAAATRRISHPLPLASSGTPHAQPAAQHASVRSCTHPPPERRALRQGECHPLSAIVTACISVSEPGSCPSPVAGKCSARWLRARLPLPTRTQSRVLIWARGKTP